MKVEQLDFDAGAGRRYVALDVGAGISGALRVLLPPEADAVALAERLNAALESALADVLEAAGGEWEQLWDGFQPLVRETWGKPAGEILGTPEEQRRQREEFNRACREEFQAADAQRKAWLAADPHNGTLGYWRVEGVRHDAIVRASSALEAVQKAAAVVQDWESPIAQWLGEELPEVVSDTPG